MSKKPLPIVLPAILEQALKEECRNTRIPEYRTILLILTEHFRDYSIYHLGEPAYKQLVKKYSKTIDQDTKERYERLGLPPPNQQNQKQEQGEPYEINIDSLIPKPQKKPKPNIVVRILKKFGWIVEEEPEKELENPEEPEEDLDEQMEEDLSLLGEPDEEW